MDELIRAFRKFIFRDFFYGISGGMIILQFHNFFDLNYKGFPGEMYLMPIMICGLSYCVGYINQEIWSQFRFVTTAAPKWNGTRKCPQWLQNIYSRHTGELWDDPKPTQKQLNAGFNDEQIDRIINHLHIGIGIGTSLLTILLMRCAFDLYKSFNLLFNNVLTEIDYKEIVLLSIIAFLACSSLALGWLKTMQRAKYCAELAE